MRKVSVKIVFLLLTSLLCTCQDDSETLVRTKHSKHLEKEVAEAQQWYENNRRGQTLLITRSARSGSRIEIKPDWEQAEALSDKRQKIVETCLYVKGGFFMAMPENKRKYEETGDERYIASFTRLVVRTKRRSGVTDGFLMTVMPSVEYLELTGFNAFEDVKYIGRDKRFTGRVIYHDLDGRFANGWVYKNGKITHTVRRAQEGEDRIIMMRSSGHDDCQLVEYWGWTRTCTDWYQYDYYGNPIYTNTTCTDWEWELLHSEYECSGNGNGDGEDGGDTDGEDGGSSGGGGSGEYNPPYSPNFTNLERIMKNNQSMLYYQKERLSQALNSLISQGCMQRAMYNALANNNVKLDFGMYYSPSENSAPASYNPSDKSVRFRDYNSITAENLKEELFHAWQDAYYPGGTAQYLNVGKVNIEFEAKVFKDLIMEAGAYSAFFNQGTEEAERVLFEYTNWIENVKDNPSILQDQDEYNYWLDLFNEHNPEYTSPKSNNFSSFRGLSDLINNSNCF